MRSSPVRGAVSGVPTTLALAAEGAAVVANDLGEARDGSATEETPAHEVVGEIRAGGGRAIASRHDVSHWNAAGALIDAVLSQFGRLDVLDI